jgi:hypothetical protein
MDTPQGKCGLTATDYDAAIRILEAAASLVSIWDATTLRILHRKKSAAPTSTRPIPNSREPGPLLF